jgi:hypothetical protein
MLPLCGCTEIFVDRSKNLAGECQSVTGTLHKESKIGTLADFLDLHLADFIPRVLAKIESVIVVITLYCSLSLSIAREFDFGDGLDRFRV